MDLNPYAMYLGDGDPLEVITSTPDRLSRLTSGLGPDVCDRRPATRKWSVREIIAHLADCEIVFAFRLRQTLTGDHPTLQPFDQGEWAERYALYDLPSACRLFAATRTWNVKLLRGVSAAERKLPVTHPERGTMTLWTIVETMAGHDINHLNQIERLALGLS